MIYSQSTYHLDKIKKKNLIKHIPEEMPQESQDKSKVF